MATTAPEGTNVRTVTVEPLTAEAFAPFGHVLSPEGLEREPIELYGSTKDVHRGATIESDRAMEWLVVRTMVRPFQVVYLERHMELTQAFIPLGGASLLVVVARADAREENGMPAVDELHAFIVPGTAGAQIHRGVWHEPPFALVDRTVSLTTSHRALTTSLAAEFDAKGEIVQPDVEKRNMLERTGLVVEIRLP